MSGAADDSPFDLAVIGGGINGCGIARDAAGRGARVLLLDKGDLAGATSSASSKLIHGGLRYLEHYEFGLVREALGERERLWGIAPHLVRPLRFVLPHVRGLRPRWMLRLGLFLYDHIGGRERLLPAESLNLRFHAAGVPLKREFARGFAYSDCRVDDARLVLANARDAAERGAEVRTRCEVTALAREADGWRIGTSQGAFRARALVNATGPWVRRLLDATRLPALHGIRPVRGSHIVVPRLFDHDMAYIFQLPDGRIFFAIPWQRDFTMIGTTDRDHPGSLDDVQATPEEIAYLCDGASRFFASPVRPEHVVHAWAGVRALVDDASGKPEAATRGYRLDLSEAHEGAPLLSVFGGKLTTYRHLSEEAVNRLGQRLPALRGPGWTGSRPLPGGDFPVDGLHALIAQCAARYSFLEAEWADRMVRAYGTEVFDVLGDAANLADCGQHFGHGLTERELDWMRSREWAVTAEDVLWRRSKLGLRFSDSEVEALAAAL